MRESRALPLSYFRGLNFLLNEEPDKAIESFLQVAKENPQTVELQFALGSLFRRRYFHYFSFSFQNRNSELACILAHFKI